MIDQRDLNAEVAPVRDPPEEFVEGGPIRSAGGTQRLPVVDDDHVRIFPGYGAVEKFLVFGLVQTASPDVQEGDIVQQ